LEEAHMKKYLMPTVAIAISWMGLDFIIHHHLLMSQYKATMTLWRPMEEINMACGVAAALLLSLIFVLAYHNLSTDKSVKGGAKFGAWTGALVGVALASFYLYLPIPGCLAFGWFAASLIEFTAAGALVSYLTKES